ncbi:alpha/beta hydrolase [Paenibacillus sp. FJAT-26967]|uniref:alpha/beta hydrolase n=1 Tax=Paenibacillus sp. FJAT-26967 TaxID=1729690 RepID=UPI000837F46C|nr:alpha/beta hydrolase [Paenibacillus sp. FJAT-26967]
MPVEPRIGFMLRQMNAAPQPDYEQLSADELRRSKNPVYVSEEGREEVQQVADRAIPLEGRDVTVRVYTPEGEAPYPALVYYHGGGFVLGSLDSHDSICRNLANSVHAVVISVDYRLAPEHKFPAAVEDAYEALQWIAEHPDVFGIDSARMAVGGDSAGGTLAAVTSIKARDAGKPALLYQLLCYPAAGFEEEDPASLRENGEGYILTAGMMEWFSKQYLNKEEEIRNPYAYPIHFQTEDLTGLPPAMVVTAQYDPLRDSGQAYAEKLMNAGVEVVYKNYEDLVHGFMNMHQLVPRTQEALNEMSSQLRLALGTNGEIN